MSDFLLAYSRHHLDRDPECTCTSTAKGTDTLGCDRHDDGRNDGSSLDCVECGGFIDQIQRPAEACRRCEDAERREREDDDAPECEMCEYSPGAIYEHAADCYDPEDDRPNLCSGTGVHYDDCRGTWIPCPSCQPTPAPDALRSQIAEQAALLGLTADEAVELGRHGELPQGASALAALVRRMEE